MNTTHLSARRSPQEHAALVDAAKRRAIELRTEAIGAFWSGLGQGARHVWQTIRRAAPPSPVQRTGNTSPFTR